MLLALILLVLLLGGGGGFYGWHSWGPAHGGGILGLVLVVAVIVYLVRGRVD